METILPKISYSTVSGLPIQSHMWQNSIAIEIEDIEPKTEQYSITIGFLNLFKSSITHICSNQSPQYPVLDGCLNFIINSVMLKVKTRSFKYEEERWAIIKKSFKILNILAMSYEPSVDGLNLKGSFNVFFQTLQEDNLFKFIIYILEDIFAIIDSRPDQNYYEKTYELMEKSAMYSLKLLNHICEKQNEFIQMIHEISGFPTATILSLDRLFCNVNPKNNLNDRLATLVCLVSLPYKISIEAINLLNNLIKNDSEISSQLLIQLQVTNSKISEDVLLNLFVECLESQMVDLRLSVLQLLLTSLENANISYDFSHKILGFDKKFSIKEPGTLGQVYSCFHSILGFFDSSVDMYEHKQERELAMRIVYTLCISPHTFENVLRFIRTSYDFLIIYLQNWKKKLDLEPNFFVEKSLLSEYSYFLQILSIEIKSTAGQNLKSYCSAYINFLLSDSKKRFLLLILSSNLFEHTSPTSPTLEYFELKEILKAISDSTMSESATIDLKILHQRLINEVKTVSSQLGLIQKKQVYDEINLILKFATSLNESQKVLKSKISFFESCRQLIETLIFVNGLNFFNDEVCSRILLEIIHELISRALIPSTITSLLIPISSIIFSCSLVLYKIKNITSSNLITCVKSITTLLESSSLTIWNQQKRKRIHLYASLLYLLHMFPYGLGSEFKLSTRLLDKLCKDILSGHEIAKVLAILLLNQSDSSYINEIFSNGTLKLLMDSLITDDKEIKENKCELTKVFYTFDAKLVRLILIS